MPAHVSNIKLITSNRSENFYDIKWAINVMQDNVVKWDKSNKLARRQLWQAVFPKQDGVQINAIKIMHEYQTIDFPSVHLCK